MLRWVTKYTRTAFPKYRLVEKKEVSQASHTSLHSVCTWQYCAIHNHSGFDVTSPLLCLHVQCTIQCVFTVFGPKKGVMKVSWCKPGNPSPEDELSDGVVAMGDSGRSGWGGNRMYNTVEQLSKLYCSTLSVSMEGWMICRTNHVARILRNTAIEIWVTILPGRVVTEFHFQRNVFSMIRFFWSLYQTSMFPDIFEEYDCDTFTFYPKIADSAISFLRLTIYCDFANVSFYRSAPVQCMFFLHFMVDVHASVIKLYAAGSYL